MTLRMKTFISIALTLIALVFLQYFNSRRIVIQNYSNLERSYAEQNVIRMNNIIDDGVSTLDALTADWAYWDDTYSFIEDRNDKYVKSNLIPETFTTLKLNLMLYINNSREIVYGEVFNLKTLRKTEVTKTFLAYIPIEKLFSRGSKIKKAGIVSLPQGPMFIAARPILTSHGRGPSRGLLIFGRYFDSSEVGHLGKLIDLPVKVVSINTPVTRDFLRGHPSLSKRSIVVQALSSSRLGGYSMVRDIFGKPRYMMRVDSPRTIFSQSQASTIDFFSSILLIGFIFILLVLSLMERILLSRIAGLGGVIREIGLLCEIPTRLTTPVKDELTSMGQILSGAILTIKESGRKVRKNELQFYSVAQIASDAIVVLDSTGKIFHWNDSAEKMFGYSANKAIGTHIREIIPGVEVQEKTRQQSADMKIIQKTVEMTGKRKDGSRFPLDLSISSWQVADEGYFTIIVRDISGRKAKESELEKHREGLEDLVEQRAADIRKVNKQLSREIEERKRVEDERKRVNERLRDAYRKQKDISVALQGVFEPVSPPRLPKADLSTIYQSATEEAFVGGDFFDFVSSDSAATVILLGDVSGKGIEASAQQLATRHFARSLIHLGISMEKMLLRLNDELFREMRAGLFVSLLFILYMPEGSLFWSSAGHPLPFILRKDGAIEQLPRIVGPPLGVTPEPGYEMGTERLDQGDLLLGYTDGLLEVKRDGELYGEERISASIRDHRSEKKIEMVLQGLLNDAIQFGQGELKDDLAMFCLKKL